MLYSGDNPNPSLRSFVMAHMQSRPFDPDTDDYRPQEFTSPIITTKTSPVYSMHSYHLGKKPHDALEAYINHYTSRGDLVLDPFCGSGSTSLAALVQGRKAVAIDASPAATFITRFYLSRCDPADLAARFERMCAAVSEEMQYLYGTICHRCNSPAIVHYVIYSNLYKCPSCCDVAVSWPTSFPLLKIPYSPCCLARVSSRRVRRISRSVRRVAHL